MDRARGGCVLCWPCSHVRHPSHRLLSRPLPPLSPSDPRSTSNYLTVEVPTEVVHIEAQLVAALFRLLELHDQRIDRFGILCLSHTRCTSDGCAGPTPHTKLLELAFIQFLKASCKAYLTDSGRRVRGSLDVARC